MGKRYKRMAKQKETILYHVIQDEEVQQVFVKDKQGAKSLADKLTKNNPNAHIEIRKTRTVGEA